MRNTSQAEFLNQVLFNTTIIAVIGAGCSAATIPIAEISPYFGLSQVLDHIHVHVHMYAHYTYVVCIHCPHVTVTLHY